MYDILMLALSVAFFGVCGWILLSKAPKKIKQLEEVIQDKTSQIDFLSTENTRLSKIVNESALKRLGSTDRQEIDGFTLQNQIPVKARVFLCYTDFHGEPTERQVDIETCDLSSQNGYFTGFCHLKNEVRTFKISRVRACVDLDTGELISDFSEFAQNRKVT